MVFQPILFGLTGALVEFSQIDGEEILQIRAGQTTARGQHAARETNLCGPPVLAECVVMRIMLRFITEF